MEISANWKYEADITAPKTEIQNGLYNTGLVKMHLTIFILFVYIVKMSLHNISPTECPQSFSGNMAQKQEI